MAMSRNEIEQKLLEVMKMAMPGQESILEGVSESSRLVDDLGLSSVGVLFVVIAIEEYFDIRFDDVGFADFKTVGDVVDYIERKV